VRAAVAVMASVAVAFPLHAAAADTSGCQFARIAEWPIRIERGHLIADGAINGKPVRVLLDTGSTLTLIPRAAAERLELTRKGVKGARMYGMGGVTAIDSTLVDEFRVGQFSRKNVLVTVAGEHDFGAEVLLGGDFFRQFDVEFDIAVKMVRLYRPENCATSLLAYWADANVGQVEFEPVNEVHPQIILTVEINGRPLKALFDSGAAGSLLDKAEAARVGVTPDTPGVVALGMFAGLGSEMVPAWAGSFASFTVGNETIRDTEIAFADTFKGATTTRIGSHIPVKPDGLPSMLLGVDFLRSHRVLVAHSQRRIYFTYNGGPVFQRAPRGSTGK
jgi:clan AA aspartic protease (TIGR02281 family)